MTYYHFCKRMYKTQMNKEIRKKALKISLH
jgi:hypothetical protein